MLPFEDTEKEKLYLRREHVTPQIILRQPLLFLSYLFFISQQHNDLSGAGLFTVKQYTDPVNPC